MLWKLFLKHYVKTAEYFIFILDRCC